MPNTFTLTATQVGSNMNYVISPLVSVILFTSSFTLPVNPVPSGGPVDGQVPPYSIGAAFVLSNPTGTPGGSTPTSFLFDSIPSTPLALVFYNTSLGGAFQALTTDSNGGQVSIYGFSGPALYSGIESAPTMLAGTFTLTLYQTQPPHPNVYKVNYHFELNGKRSSPDLYNYVAAFSQNYNDILAVLVNNNLIQNGVAVIDGVQIYNQAILT